MIIYHGYGSIHNKNRYLKINFPARWAQEPAKKTSGRNDFHCHRGSNGENPPGLLAHAPAPTFPAYLSLLYSWGGWYVVRVRAHMSAHGWPRVENTILGSSIPFYPPFPSIHYLSQSVPPITTNTTSQQLPHNYNEILAV
jgi:hypothetical protein